MKLKKGADVLSSSGEKIGSLDRVVINPATKKVTHIVVEKGIFFEKKKLVPIEYVNPEEPDAQGQILLNQNKEELDKSPNYEESAFIGLDPNDYPDENVEAVYWYPSMHISSLTMAEPLPYSSPERHYARAETVIPAGTVALKEGAQVISNDGKHIGNVEQVIVESSPEHLATHIVVSEGIFLKKKKLVPAHWIADADDDKVHLSVGSSLFDKLPDYEAVTRTI